MISAKQIICTNNKMTVNGGHLIREVTFDQYYVLSFSTDGIFIIESLCTILNVE
ncbi:hypothetical protein [Alkalibaculum bacchi]|uniref:hypothetical protein n=1 Tax=Alkalibaculum bacchi TaxID=645887 RepID=UPI00147651A5|nr:hypothetical protein [Alkalibaculum bacchi]